MFNYFHLFLLILLIDSEESKEKGWTGAVHMYIFYKLKSKIGESQEKGPDVSEQIAVCLRERPGSQNVRHVAKSSFRRVFKKNGCPFRIADGRKPYFLRKKTHAGWLAGWSGCGWRWPLGLLGGKKLLVSIFMICEMSGM